jgi:hypothetical protein
MYKSRYLSIKNNGDESYRFHIMDLFKILAEMPLEDKLIIIFNYHKQLGKKWKSEYDQFRVKNVPAILCRICNKEFYTDMAEIHNLNCMEKNTKTKAQKDMNTQFMILSN